MACPVRIQERLRGWRCGGPLFRDRPCEDLSVPLTRGCTRHNGWRGGVLSPHASTASGTMVQWSGWRHDGGDGRIGPTVTEVTAPAGLTSRRRPVRSRSSRASSLPFRGCSAPAVRKWVVQCYGVVADHAAQCRTTAGMASPAVLAEQCQGVIPRRIVARIRL
jgi:hypothetical protein